MSSSEIILQGKGLSRCYQGEGVSVNALSDATFEIHNGEFIVVLGPSGSGKSTLLNLLGGMDRPTAGQLWHGKQELTQLSDSELSVYRKDVVGFIFQFFNLIPSLTALENVELAASIADNPMSSRDALELVGLTGREKHFPSQLSGGEQQRVSIARAIVKRPSLLLCDEPTGALDSKNSVTVVDLLLRVRNELGCPVITITHHGGMAQVADRVFHMKDGKLDTVTTNTAPISAAELAW